MKHYDFTAQFRSLYDQALTLYADGQRGAGTAYFTAPEQAWLARMG